LLMKVSPIVTGLWGPVCVRSGAFNLRYEVRQGTVGLEDGASGAIALWAVFWLYRSTVSRVESAAHVVFIQKPLCTQ
jgi:hypothetical protein